MRLQCVLLGADGVRNDDMSSSTLLTMRADPEASDLVAAVGRECGATSRWVLIKVSGSLSLLIAPLAAQMTFKHVGIKAFIDT